MKPVCHNGKPELVNNELVKTLRNFLDASGWSVYEASAYLNDGFFLDDDGSLYDDKQIIDGIEDIIYLLEDTAVSKAVIIFGKDKTRLQFTYDNDPLGDRALDNQIVHFEYLVERLWEPDAYRKGRLLPKKNTELVSWAEEQISLLKQHKGTAAFEVKMWRVHTLCDILAAMGVV